MLPRDLAKLICFTDKNPMERSRILETTHLFADIHDEVANQGQTAAPSADTRTNLHFTCFVEAPSSSSRIDGTEVEEGARRVIELDGRRNGPIDRGASKNFLQDVADFVKKNYVDGSASVEFSMLALAPPLED